MTVSGSISQVNAREVIQDEIQRKGPISFARFMELALYAPQVGYYETHPEIGKRGDFYTSVSVGALFGMLLAQKFAAWANEIDGFEICEAGAHRAELARDILKWFSHFRTDLYPRLRYTIVEPKLGGRVFLQRDTLADFLPRVRWADHFPPFNGVFFSNELLDAMPVHRLRWNGQTKKWGEWWIAGEGERLVSMAGDISEEVRPHMPIVRDDLAEVLPDGFTTEVSPSAIKWWREAAQSLKKGRLMAIDYGLTEDEFFRPDRANGTARAYYRHHHADDLLANPGEQDITAHVNWTAIQRAGEEAGLQTEIFYSQEKFLMNIVKDLALDNWTSEHIRQLQTLTHPNFLGRAFRVLVQKRD